MENEEKMTMEEALDAINVLTEKLINLAVVENKFIKMTEDLKKEMAACRFLITQAEELNNTISFEANYLTRLAQQNLHYYRFRWKWMERLFFAHRGDRYYV